MDEFPVVTEHSFRQWQAENQIRLAIKVLRTSPTKSVRQPFAPQSDLNSKTQLFPGRLAQVRALRMIQVSLPPSAAIA